MTKFVFISLISAVLLSACATAPADRNISELEGTWDVVEMMSVDIKSYLKPVPHMSFPSFTIEGEKFSGSDGCNSFGGTVILEDAGLKFDKGTQTLMACVMQNKKDTPDFLFNAAINRNPEFVKTTPGSYSIKTDLPPEYRDWRITETGHLEIIKEGVVTLRAKPSSAKWKE